jgi:hypothetical protein
MCEQREDLVAYLYDEVDANERRAVEKHLETCETCREELRAFRDVRQDLLAWDVPAHESVWKPFVTARTQPVWRQMPVWAMAAAAMLVFAVGGVGGFAGRVLASRAIAPAQVAAVQPAAEPVTAPPAVTPAATREEWLALQTRLGQLERAASVRTVSSTPVSMSASARADLLKEIDALIRESEGRVNHRTSQKIVNAMQEIGRQHAVDNAALQQLIADAQERTNGNILAVKNMRAEKEKE